MHNIDHGKAEVLELTPYDLLRYVKGKSLTRVADVETAETGAVCYQFQYNTSGEYEYDSGKHDEYTPVLASTHIKKLLEKGAIHYHQPDPDWHLFVIYTEDTTDHEYMEARKDDLPPASKADSDLKIAFYANHEPHDFGGKDPRRVWNDASHT